MTLGTLNIAFAITQLYSSSQTVTDLPDAMSALGGTFRLGGTAVVYGVVLMLLLYVIAWFILRETASGEVELKCPGAVEGAVFGNGVSLDVADLARRARVPATVLWARRGDFSLAVYESVFGAMERAEIVEVDAGHLVPMERPELVVDAVRAAARSAAAA